MGKILMEKTIIKYQPNYGAAKTTSKAKTYLQFISAVHNLITKTIDCRDKVIEPGLNNRKKQAA